MLYLKERSFARWFVTIASLVIVGLFLWNVSIFFERIKEEEKNKMEIWVNAFTEVSTPNSGTSLSNNVIEIFSSNTTTPMLVYSVGDDSYNSRNIEEDKVNTREKKLALIEEFKKQYQPIEIKDDNETINIVYYGYSDTLKRLTYFPAFVIFIIILFLSIIYYFHITSKSEEQSLLWAGMAKETAHQIGTPLSSLVGWIEILKSENINPDYVQEIQKDINRLQTITDRFSKIGSVPNLTPTNLVQATLETSQYLQIRTSKLVQFNVDLPKHSIFVNLNEQLFSWTIENLVKNAIDAMKGKGTLKIEMREDAQWVLLYISDTGKGIPKSDFKKIFKPGFTTKKRGWGLGLSLVKRIIETYHKGKVRVLKSELNQGTCFEIKLKKIKS
ncbi:HAMP domain-containing sensor histidine kinase [Mesonia sp. HuA40]|uniref:sensor histidine kinase n=1 Tax=Mesonia sp. HuA40 TaxID=2602761 RepID=UPI0011CB4981|nr:HAMP domain-containing sensor histidine kinase [Mesonia sp. HuA40]TXK71600.1 HAMP domain-containing histidine kinase [Mesonia sp. HuA40]